jgi:hypothetical protein
MIAGGGGLMLLQGKVVTTTPQDQEGWVSSEKRTVVLETAGLNTSEVGAFCRERGQTAKD